MYEYVWLFWVSALFVSSRLAAVGAAEQMVLRPCPEKGKQDESRKLIGVSLESDKVVLTGQYCNAQGW
jgi:hypothetical protein